MIRSSPVLLAPWPHNSTGEVVEQGFFAGARERLNFRRLTGSPEQPRNSAYGRRCGALYLEVRACGTLFSGLAHDVDGMDVFLIRDHLQRGEGVGARALH